MGLLTDLLSAIDARKRVLASNLRDPVGAMGLLGGTLADERRRSKRETEEAARRVRGGGGLLGMSVMGGDRVTDMPEWEAAGLAPMGLLGAIKTLPDAEFRSLGNGIFQVMADGREVGRASLSDNGPYLSSVRLDPEFQGHGIGQRLYDYIEKHIGAELRPSPVHQTDAAKRMWEKRAKAKAISDDDLREAKAFAPHIDAGGGSAALNSGLPYGSERIWSFIDKGILVEDAGYISYGPRFPRK